MKAKNSYSPLGFRVLDLVSRAEPGFHDIRSPKTTDPCREIPCKNRLSYIIII